MVVFDTEALLIFYLGEEGAEVVADLLRRIQNKETKGFLNIVNLTEFYYILYRRDAAIAEEKVRNLRAYGMEIVPLIVIAQYPVVSNFISPQNSEGFI